MIRFSMYSGEEIEMDDATNDIVKSASIEKTRDVYSKENKKNAGLISAEGDGKLKSSDEEDETYMSSLALMEDFNDHDNTANKKETAFSSQSARNSACFTNGSYANFKMKNNQFPSSPNTQLQNISCLEDPLISQGDTISKMKSFDPEQDLTFDSNDCNTQIDRIVLQNHNFILFFILITI